MKVLFIEDDFMTIEAMSDHLRITGHTVDIVDNIQDAIDRFEAENYDYVFSDIMIAHGKFFSRAETTEGRYTGLKLLEHFRALETKKMKEKHTKIFLITNWRDEPQVESIANKYEAAILRKPLSIQQFSEIGL